MPSPLRGTRNRKRSTKGSRLKLQDRQLLMSTCRHKRIRYRNSSTEAVCQDCGAVQVIKRTGQLDITVVKSWHLPEELEEVEDVLGSES